MPIIIRVLERTEAVLLMLFVSFHNTPRA